MYGATPPSNTQKNKRNNCWLFRLLCLLSVGLVYAIYTYVGSTTTTTAGTLTRAANHQFLESAVIVEVDEVYHNEREEIEIELEPEQILYSQGLIHGSSEWTDFHAQILESMGHSINDQSKFFAFIAYDYDYDDDELQEAESQLSPDGNRVKGGKKTIGALSCYTKYLVMTSGRSSGGGFMASLQCKKSGTEQLFGCSSMLNNPMLNAPNHGTSYIRSGERFSGDWSGNTQKCASFALNGDNLGLGIRCCDLNNVAKTVPANVVLDRNRISWGYSNPNVCSYCNYEEHGWCNGYGSSTSEWQHNLDEKYIVIGCTGWTDTDIPKWRQSVSVTMTTQMIGSWISGGKCRAQRGDEQGLIAGIQLGARVRGTGQYSCQSVGALDPATYLLSNDGGDVYRSQVTCPADHNVVDCYSTVEGLTGTCDATLSKDTTFGASFISSPSNGCQAIGNSDKVRAGAHCCSVVYGCMDYCWMDAERNCGEKYFRTYC